MLDDAFKLTLDKIFPCPTHLNTFEVDGYKSNENLWEPLNIR
jgi:hypothetical protein